MPAPLRRRSHTRDAGAIGQSLAHSPRSPAPSLDRSLTAMPVPSGNRSHTAMPWPDGAIFGHYRGNSPLVAE
jgi:hypothetical protein